MDTRDPIARAQARRAYERGQLRAGVATAAPMIVLAPLAALLHRGVMPGSTPVVALVLGAALIAFGWRGGPWRRAVPVGLLAGLPGLIVPRLILAPLSSCAACEPMTCAASTCFLACGGAGVVAGIAIATLAARDASPGRFAIAAATIACLTATLTCAIAGAAGVLGVVAGLALATAPTVWLRTRATI